ncbi:MAG: DUF4190 domain-containing protein [Clostridia bacterium]|nr:DUF4190 domain-containing protein [Clostridia bacterium]
MEENNEVKGTNGGQNGLAIAGFVVSLCSLLINFAGLVGLVGTVLSGVGLAKVKTTGKGKGMAIAGLIIGIISILWGIYSIYNAANILSQLSNMY